MTPGSGDARSGYLPHGAKAAPIRASRASLMGSWRQLAQRLGKEGMRDASRGASSGSSMTVPGVGREHQAELDELARSFVQGLG